MKLRLANGKLVDGVSGSVKVKENAETGEGIVLISCRARRADGEWDSILLRPETDGLKAWAADKDDPAEALRVARLWSTVKTVKLSGEKSDWGTVLPSLEKASDDGKTFLIRGKLDAVYDVLTRVIEFEPWASTVSLDVWNAAKDAARANYKSRRRPALDEGGVPKPAEKPAGKPATAKAYSGSGSGCNAARPRKTGTRNR